VIVNPPGEPLLLRNSPSAGIEGFPVECIHQLSMLLWNMDVAEGLAHDGIVLALSQRVIPKGRLRTHWNALAGIWSGESSTCSEALPHGD